MGTDDLANILSPNFELNRLLSTQFNTSALAIVEKQRRT